MSDNVSPATFNIVWDELCEESAAVVMSDIDFLNQFGIEVTDFEDEMEIVSVSPVINIKPPSTKMNTETNTEVNTETKANTVTNEEMESRDTNTKSDSESTMTRGNEFNNMSSEEVKQFIESEDNKATMKKTLADVRKFERFLVTKGESRPIHQLEVDHLDEYLANFVLSVRKKDGADYEPSSLRGMISSIDRKLKRQKYAYKIMSDSGAEFQLTRDALKAKQKFLKKAGKGNKPRTAQPITDDEINLLHERGLLGDSNPTSLLNSMWLNNTIHFGLRGTKENYNLR